MNSTGGARMTMEFGLGRATTFVELVDDAVWAERNGFVAVCLSDHFLRAGAEDPSLAAVLPASDPFVTIAALARETETIELIVTMAAATFRHPAVVLKSTIDLDAISDGRFHLGLGTGYRASEHHIFGVPFPELGERYAMLEEQLGYLRAGLSTPNRGFDGRLYHLDAHPICPPPTGRPRLLVGGQGPRRTPEVAGRLADEFNVFPMGLDDVRVRIDRAREACRRAGRDPDDLVISSGGPIIAGATRAEYLDALGEASRRARVDLEVLERDHRAHGRLIGTFDEVATRLEGFAGAGISRFYIGVEGVGALDRERLLATIAAVSP